MNVVSPSKVLRPDAHAKRASDLLLRMTLAEKIGQMCQVFAGHDYAPDYLADGLRQGHIGSVLNIVDVDAVNELQRISVEESRLGIPLLVGRDVIHGFKTVMPIPLGQAASWNPDLVREAARIAAGEASGSGVNWTFAPMIDISRDPRWGRIAESLGECEMLTSRLGVAMVEGFQTDNLADIGAIAACAKHFAGYGAAESGRDYATTNIAEHELRNVHLRPFQALARAGVASFMASFSDLNGVPSSANDFLLRQILRDEWRYDGLVVSDWDSIRQLQVHGLTEDDRASALAAVTAGLDMEMAGDAYSACLADLVASGEVDTAAIDAAVLRILGTKSRLGLFERPYTDTDKTAPVAAADAFAVARKAALQSVVMLKNSEATLPLRVDELESVAVIGPLADAPYQQLGTWIFDGDADLSVTPLTAIKELLGDRVSVSYARAMETSRSRAGDMFNEAVDRAAAADVALLFLGEESILSGEAHCRANIDLPGDQAELVQRIRATGKPVVAVILAGRPLTLTNIVDDVDAILYAWHPGTMGGPAIADLLFGIASPSGKLPATFPRVVGQIPIYYSQKHSGKPATHDNITHIDAIDAHARQTSIGMSAFHLDTHFTPLFEFGFGLSYAEFEYRDVRCSRKELQLGDSVIISAELTNRGDIAADEIVQLYLRDLVANVTRPVRELKDFQRLHLEPGETRTVEFVLHTDNLSFFGRDMREQVEPGEFHAWIGGSSAAEGQAGFRVLGNK